MKTYSHIRKTNRIQLFTRSIVATPQDVATLHTTDHTPDALKLARRNLESLGYTFKTEYNVPGRCWSGGGGFWKFTAYAANHA